MAETQSQKDQRTPPFISRLPPFVLPRLPPLLPPRHSHADWQVKQELLLAQLHGLVRRLHSALEQCRSSLLSTFHGLLLAVDAHSLQKKWTLELPCPRSHHRHALSSYNFAAILPGDSVAGLVAANGVLNFLNIYNTLLVVRLILTWFPQPPQIIANPLSTICDPYLNIFRGIIPPLGGTIDLSPILAFLVLNAFTNAATALPAELGRNISAPGEAAVIENRQAVGFPSLTGIQRAWLRRQAATMAKRA